MTTVCKENQCAGCMACVEVCPSGAIEIRDDVESYNAVIHKEKCVDCGGCYRVCQKNHPDDGVSPVKWYQGWADAPDIREQSSSGGAAAAISKAFINEGGYVCSCVFDKGVFTFKVTNDISELDQFKGSKYVKSNPVGIYKEVQELLKRDESVLFIGLPCQVAALKRFVGENLYKNLYTVDLICHGTPSPKLLNKFIQQYGYELDKIHSISFRRKGRFSVENEYKNLVTVGTCDRYTIAFLNALILTKNCYSCDYAKLNRVADLTLGDSYGSELTEEMAKGVSLILCQTEKGIKMVEGAKLHLETVDIKTAIENNGRLNHPSIIPKNREKFFKSIAEGKNINKAIFRNLPNRCFRQEVKKLFIEFGIISVGITYGISVQTKINTRNRDL